MAEIFCGGKWPLAEHSSLGNTPLKLDSNGYREDAIWLTAQFCGITPFKLESLTSREDARWLSPQLWGNTQLKHDSPIARDDVL